jgi:hypothetical protein
MYLFVAFFKEDVLNTGKYYFSKEYLNGIRKVFPDYKELSNAEIEGCIGFIKGTDYKTRNCYALKIKGIEANDERISINFDSTQELNISNEFIDKSLYKFAVRSNWINKDDKYYPLLSIVNKEDFDLIRKGEVKTRKQTNNTARIEELFSESNWLDLCNLFEPFDDINKDDIWSSVDDLYKVAFACSKLGEPRNGRERDTQHLSTVKRYRDLSLKLYKRCCDLEPLDFRYTSAVAYRHYQSIKELTKPKGRRDGKVSDELAEALEWYDKTLELNPNSIKDNYRKGKLILETQIGRIKRDNKEWTQDVRKKIEELEKEGFHCLDTAISEFEKPSENSRYYLKEYVKTLYCLGCYYIDKPKNIWNDYICRKIVTAPMDFSITRKDIGYIEEARKYFERCYNAESDRSLEEDIDVKSLMQASENWSITPLDKLYRLGQVYLEMFFIKYILNGKDNDRVILYGRKCEKYLIAAKQFGDEHRKNHGGRNPSYIDEKLSHYYILQGNIDRAIELTEKLRDSYTKNTYAIALLLSNRADRFNKAEHALITAKDDQYNQAKDISSALLGYVYKLSGDEGKYEAFYENKKDKLNYAGKNLVTILENQEIKS